MARKTKDEKSLKKILKNNEKEKRKYSTYYAMKKRVKNSKAISNIKEVDDSGLLYLKSGEVASILEVKAIDLSLTSNHEKNLFFNVLKTMYQIPNLNMKIYKLDEKLNLNSNKINLDNIISTIKIKI